MTEHSYNPVHAIGTCGNCGEEMIYNVPRLGGNGGYIHKRTRSFACNGELQQISQASRAELAIEGATSHK